MANQEHVDLLKQGVKAWNRWRERHPEINPDLSNANLCRADLRDAFLYGVDFSGANLSRADLRDTDLRDARFHGADLNRANLSNADIDSSIDFEHANFSGTTISRQSQLGNKWGLVWRIVNGGAKDADLIDADLYAANLSGVDLSGVDLSGANLSHANLSGANLSSTNLTVVKALNTNFQSAILTGACIRDWHINAHTNLLDVICEYIFIKTHREMWWQFTDRCPHDPNQIFAPGEFTKRYQIVLESVELFFNDGIDWKAFLASLQELQTQYGNELGIQGIEKKAEGSFVVRLEVPSNVDKGAIERTAKELYETKLQILETRYHAELRAKDKEIESYRRESANMMEITKLLASRPIHVEATAVADNQSSSENFNTYLQGATIGNYANKMQDQASQQTNQYIGANLDEINTLIRSLRGIAESFPQEQRGEAIDHLDDLESDLKQSPEKRKLSRTKAALVALLGIATAVSGAVAGANEFVTQVQELSDKLGIPLPIEQVQPQSHQPDAIDVKAVEPESP